MEKPPGDRIDQPLLQNRGLVLSAQIDLKQGVVGAVPIPSDDAGKEDVIAALVANVEAEAMIRADRKITIP